MEANAALIISLQSRILAVHANLAVESARYKISDDKWSKNCARYEISHKQALRNDLSHDISRFWTSATSYWNSADDFP